MTASSTPRDLIAEKYVIVACPSEPGLFLVGKPSGDAYRTNGIARHCSCPARGVCCHLTQLDALIQAGMTERIVQAATTDDAHKADVLLVEVANLAAQWAKCFASRVNVPAVQNAPVAVAAPVVVAQPLRRTFAQFHAAQGRFQVRGKLSRTGDWETASGAQIRDRATAERLASDIRKSARYVAVEVVCLAGETAARKVDIAA